MEKTQNKFLIPAAIIIAGGLIAWGMISSGTKVEPANNTIKITDSAPQAESIQITVKSTDHLLGNPDAKLTIIGFSDFNCGYCKRFHQTMKQIMDEYGKDGRIAWVFRAFPISGADGQKKAEAAECVAKLGGDAKYWEFSDKLFGSETQTSLEQLPDIAESIGLDKTKFSKCLDEGQKAELVKANYDSGIAAGVLGTPQEPGGTPHTLIIAKSGEIFPISGAQPYSVVKSMIDLVLEK